MSLRCVCLLSTVLFSSVISGATAPQVTSVSPEIGPVGTQVTITGSGFGGIQGSSTVALYSSPTPGSYATAAVVSWSDTQIVATVPSVATTGAVKVTVAGVASNTNIYFNVPGPQVTSISPANGVVGAQVTINGTGFQSAQGSGRVAFNQSGAAVTSWSDTQIIAAVANGTTTGPVWVMVNNSLVSNQDVLFTMPNPTIGSFSPAVGPAGTLVTISGTGFGATQGTNAHVLSQYHGKRGKLVRHANHSHGPVDGINRRREGDGRRGEQQHEHGFHSASPAGQ